MIIGNIHPLALSGINDTGVLLSVLCLIRFPSLGIFPVCVWIVLLMFSMSVYD